MADYIDSMASVDGHVVTMEAARMHRLVHNVVDNALKLVVLSEHMASDAAFVRQVRRKFTALSRAMPGRGFGRTGRGPKQICA
jgi:hypothetical protein